MHFTVWVFVVVVGIIVASALYMMKDLWQDGWAAIGINLGVIGATWALLSFSRLPSPVIVLIWLAVGWLMMVL